VGSSYQQRHYQYITMVFYFGLMERRFVVQ
jgi:hypothetical protein